MLVPVRERSSNTVEGVGRMSPTPVLVPQLLTSAAGNAAAAWCPNPNRPPSLRVPKPDAAHSSDSGLHSLPIIHHMDLAPIPTARLNDPAFRNELAGNTSPYLSPT